MPSPGNAVCTVPVCRLWSASTAGTQRVQLHDGDNRLISILTAACHCISFKTLRSDLLRTETHVRPSEDAGVRLSDSPGRSPRIHEALTSAMRSGHPETLPGMDSIHRQADFGIRTADFFDCTSEDESPAPVDVVMLDARPSRKKNSRQRPPTGEPLPRFGVSQCEGTGGYHRPDRRADGELRVRYAETPGSSFNASFDELLPTEERAIRPRVVTAAHISRGQPPQGSAQIDQWQQRQNSSPGNKIDQLLGAHVLAHNFALHALIRDEDALDRSLQSFAPRHAEQRACSLPAALRSNDLGHLRDQNFSSPNSTSGKKVQVVPPPIDTAAPRHPIPADIVRTPYPLTQECVCGKDFGSSPVSGEAASRLPATTENTLTLGIRRADSDAMRRVTHLTIPASDDFSGTGEKDGDYTARDFDDAEFFRQLRARYRELSGTMRFLSARSLKRIAVSGPASRAVDAGYGWLHQPWSPRADAHRGLRDVFSDEEILLHYRTPALGRSRYAFVHWARRLAAAPLARTPQGRVNVEAVGERDLARKMDQPEGLAFVVRWSVLRIVVALVLVFVVSCAAVLLWVFLGRDTSAGQQPHGGSRDAGDRVNTGVLMGMCILLIGVSGICGWLGVSWLVM